jgi:histone H2B
MASRKAEKAEKDEVSEGEEEQIEGQAGNEVDDYLDYEEYMASMRSHGIKDIKSYADFVADKKKRKEEEKKEDEDYINSISFKTYIRRVFKEVVSEKSFASDIFPVVDEIIKDMIKKIAKDCATLCGFRRVRTISSSHVQTWLYLNLEGELLNHAISEGTRHITKFVSAVDTRKEEKKKEGAPKRLKSVRKNVKADLHFNISRVENLFRHYIANFKLDTRVGAVTTVYLTAVIEYIIAEIIKLADQKSKTKKIVLENIYQAIEEDKELNLFFCKLGYGKFDRKMI